MEVTMAKLTDSDINQALSSLPGWSKQGNEIAKTYSFKNYYETMAFVNATAWVSHAQDHHPDLEVGYNTCKVRYSTHSEGGVTGKDVQCAREVNRLCSGE
jgi:4a-hydroxytetrahydrobiopterin dehydratase